MGSILGAFILPHPPIIVPEVGKGSEAGAEKTIHAVKSAAAEMAALKPTTVILTSPHGTVFSDFIYIYDSPRLSGDLGKFGAENVRLDYVNNIGLVSSIIECAEHVGIPCGGLDESLIKKFKVQKKLDHGALVPLYFLNKVYPSFKLVHISMAALPFEELFKFGKCINEAVAKSDEEVVFIASGDLSHRLTPDAPYGFSEKGPEFDRLLVESFNKYDPLSLMQIETGLCEEAGECGLRSFLMMFGALDGYRVEQKVYSYEGPFGVGYSVAGFIPKGQSMDASTLERFFAQSREKMDAIRRNEDQYVGLARKTLETYVKTGKVLAAANDLPGDMLDKGAGVFVSIKKDGQLRGCIGTIYPARKNIADEIIHNAISSGTQDPRFDPVEENELEKLVYSVDVLKEPEPINSMDELDVKRYGVIVKAGKRSGLLLPNLEGVDSPEKQVEIALQKAGIGRRENYDMERFEVIRHK